MAETTNATINMPLLFGGMSHQPPHIRAANQVEDAENAVFSVVDGVSKRPGTQWIGKVDTLPVPPGSSATFSGDVDDPNPDAIPFPTAPGATGTGTGGTAGQSGSPGGPHPATCVPAAYASSYLLAGLNIKVYSVVPEFENGPLLDTFTSDITLTQKTNACVWCGTAASTSLTVSACTALDLMRTPARWNLSVFARVTAETDPTTRPQDNADATKSGSSPIATNWRVPWVSSGGIGHYGWKFRSIITIS